MGSSNHTKVETIHAKGNLAFSADLMLDKRDGVFFARVGGEWVREKTKEEATVKTRALLDKVTNVAHRQACHT